ELNGDRHERDRLVLTQPARRHQEMAHLAERVAQRQVDRRFRVDVALRGRPELRQVFRIAETVEHPLVLRLEQRILETGERGARERVLLAQEQLEGARERALDSGAAELRIAL